MKIMKILTTLAVVLLTTFTVSAQSIPNVALKTLEGQTVNTAEYLNNGKITIFSFFATWCTPCKKELDAISGMYKDWQEEYDVELVAITIDDSRQLTKVKPLISQKGWEYIVLSDVKKQLMQALNFQTIPQTFIVDQNGNTVYAHSGYAPGDEYELEDKIAELASK
jgi:peroxiredoxin